MKPEDVSPAASAALTRAFDAGHVEFRLEEEPRIVFPTDDGFQAWFLAELAAHERQVRERVAAEMRALADQIGSARSLGMEAAAETMRELADRIARGES